MIYLTAAIALSAIIQVIVGYLQWHAMRGQLDEMKAANMVVQRQLEASMGSFGVGISGDRGTISWHLQNDGKGVPARDVTWIARLKVSRVRDGAVLQMDRVTSVEPTRVLSGSTINSDFALDSSKVSRDLGQEVFDVMVTIQYESGFGKRIDESFCRDLVADESVNGPGRPLYIGDHDCAGDASFIERRRQQLQQDQDHKQPN